MDLALTIGAIIGATASVGTCFVRWQEARSDQYTNIGPTVPIQAIATLAALLSLFYASPATSIAFSLTAIASLFIHGFCMGVTSGPPA